MKDKKVFEKCRLSLRKHIQDNRSQVLADLNEIVKQSKENEMRTIHKHQLEITDEQTVNIKGFNGFLKVAEQEGNLCLWYLVNSEDHYNYTYNINIVGTGHVITKSHIHQGSYLDSVVMGSGLVWHVFTD
jgi:hypothetical protein